MALLAGEPELQAAMLRFILGLADRYAAVLVEHAGFDRDEALALAGAAAGIALTVVRFDDPTPSAGRLGRFDAALSRLERGFETSHSRPTT